MGIDCIDAIGESFDVFDSSICASDVPLWNGREVENAAKDIYRQLIHRFYATALQQEDETNVPVGIRLYEILDLEEEAKVTLETALQLIENEIHIEVGYRQFNLPADSALWMIAPYYSHEFSLDDSKLIEITECKNPFKAAVDLAKKAAKRAKKAAKKVAKFVKEHKKEILIVAGVAAVGLGAYFVAGALGAGAIAAEGEQPRRKEENEDKIEPIDQISSSPPPPQPQLLTTNLSTNALLDDTLNHLIENLQKVRADESQGATSLPDQTIHFKNSITHFLDTLKNTPIDSNQTSILDPFPHSTREKKEPSLPTNSPSIDNSLYFQSAISQFLQTFNQSVEGTFVPPSASPFPPSTSPLRSCHVKIEGSSYRGLYTGVINGIKNSHEEHKHHLEYLKKIAGDMSFEGVYNRSNSAFGDLLEVFFLNYAGIAPNTADLLLENWKRFHEENKDNPDAKYLQFTHSQGNILARDALMRAPQEIRDRVIIVAIAPAVIIPKGLCYERYHYASEKDIVHYGENLYTVTMASFNDESERVQLLEQLIKNKNDLIILKAHPGATGIDHGFESLTFLPVLKHHLDIHKVNKGIYR